MSGPQYEQAPPPGQPGGPGPQWAPPGGQPPPPGPPLPRQPQQPQPFPGQWGAAPPPPGGPGWPQPGPLPYAPYPVQPRRSNTGLIVALAAFAVLLVVVVGGVAVVLASSGSSGTDEGAGSTIASSPGAAAAPAPLSREPDGAVVMAKPGVTSPVLEVYEDFQCPVCKAFEQTSGATLADLARQGSVKIVYRPFRLFTAEPLRSNSGRAANAAACAPVASWYALHRELFSLQPAEGSTGFTPAELVQAGHDIGITDVSYDTCVTGQQRSGQVETATREAIAAGVQGTPTLSLNGRQLDNSVAFDPGRLRSAITSGGAGNGTTTA